ncbi:MAG: transposase [Okeania sp. SIO3C4]|nr:transposase [Okeania sp. SIO3B3]NER06054.1 transposase [Okeania sp. SIO3C4]
MQTKFTEQLENRKFCTERGIKISGPTLGRPPTNIDKNKKKQAQLDERLRNNIEGKFGQAKRGFSKLKSDGPTS